MLAYFPGVQHSTWWDVRAPVMCHWWLRQHLHLWLCRR